MRALRPAERGSSPNLAEAILDADPDTLLFAGSPRDLEELVARPGWRDMRAVRAGALTPSTAPNF